LCPACRRSADDTSQLSPITPASAPPVEPETVTYHPPVARAGTTPTFADAISEPAAATPTPDTVSDPDLRAGFPSAPAGYDLLRPLGSGGMGDVFLAREQATERDVAVKFLRSPGNAAAFERFLAEVRALARLDHPNIVQVFATDFFRSQPFFTMEYVPGGNLSERVAANGPLDPKEAARLIATAARAVQAAHAVHVLHRDLKPSNILLTDNGSPKVTDFGLAKRTDRDDGLTTAAAALGTPSYMPPEQVNPRPGEIGPPADVYGLGATLYHLLTGRPPFIGETPAEITARVVNDPPQRPRALRPAVPAGLEGIVLKCLEKAPAARYPTPAALADDLDRFLAGSDPAAPPLTPLRRAKQWVRRHRSRLAGTAAAAAIMIAVFALGAALWSPPKSGPPHDPLAGIEQELAEGRSVTLIPQAGPPKWHRWVLGSPELGASPTGDGSCSFETMGRTFLELCPDPKAERYLIRAEIRFVRSKLPAEVAPDGRAEGVTTAGVYFGYSATPGAAGATAHAAFLVGFDDTPRRPPQPGAVQLRRFAQLQDPNGGKPAGYKSGLGNTPFDRTPTLPGPWRAVEIEVSRNAVQARWRKPDGTMILFANLTGDAIRKEYAGLPEKLEEQSPNHGASLPDWSPRMPLGIWTDRAAIDVRNVSVTPLP